MYALFIVLNDVSKLDDVLERFVKVGVTGATVLDSQGMGGAMMHGSNKSLPLFGSLRTLMDSDRPYNKTIFTVLDSEEMVEKTVEAVRDVCEGQDPVGLGFMFSMPIGKVYGMCHDKDCR